MRRIIHLFAWTLACLLGPSCAMAQTFSPQAGKCYKLLCADFLTLLFMNRLTEAF